MKSYVLLMLLAVATIQNTTAQTVTTFTDGNPDDAITFDSAGNVYASGFVAGEIFTFTSGGTGSTFITGLDNANGIDFDSADNLYVNDWTGNELLRYLIDGSLDTSITIPGNPSGVLKAIDNDDMIYTRYGANTINRINKLMSGSGKHSVDYFHKKLGKIMWNKCGMSRNAKDLQEAITEISELRKDFWEHVKVPGTTDSMNPELEKAGRVADFLELGELFAKDALDRNESAGGHYREESVELSGEQKGEALRDDENYKYVSAWEYKGEPKDAVLHKENLVFENIELKTRSYK